MAEERSTGDGAARAGFTKFPNWLWTAGVSPEAMLTYVAIKSFAWNAKTTAFPSQATLAGLTGYCERSIRRFTGELEAAGLVSVERHPGRASVYSIVAPDGESAAVSDPGPTVRPAPDRESGTPDTESAEEEQGSRASEEDKTTTREEESSSPDGGSGVDGPGVEGQGVGGQGVALDPRDPDSWALVPDRAKVSAPGVAVFRDGDVAPTSRGRSLSPAEYWWLRERDLRDRVARLQMAAAADVVTGFGEVRG